jgi:outer membrane protein
MKASFTRLFVSALAFVPALAGAQQNVARPITLDDAVRLAQQFAPTTIAARNALRTNDASVKAAISQYIPNLSLTGSAAKSGGTTFFQGSLVPFKGDAWSYAKGYTANLQLFDGGQRWFNYKAAEANVDAAVATEVNSRYAIALNVKQQYYQILAARESEAAANRQFEQADQNLKFSVAKVIAGTATRSDSLRAAITVANARLAILTAQNNLRSANAALTRLIASPVEVTAVPSDTSEMGRIDLDSVSLARLADQGPTVRQASAALVAANASRKAAKTPFLPTINSSYSFNENNSNTDFTWGGGPASTSNNLRLSISYPIFNNYAREQSLVLATVAADNAEANYRDLKLGQQQQLVQLLGTFHLAEERVKVQLVTIQSAEEDLRVQQQRYNLGASTQLDVITSQSTLDNARAALIQARFDARTAKAQIEALVGRDLK